RSAELPSERRWRVGQRAKNAHAMRDRARYKNNGRHLRDDAWTGAHSDAAAYFRWHPPCSLHVEHLRLLDCIMRILVVDDNDDVRRIIAHMLHQHGFEVVTAAE